MLRRSFFALVLGAIALATIPEVNAARCGDRAPFKADRVIDRKIDTGRFLSKIMADTNATQYMGFAVVLYDDRGRRLAFARRGWAVSPCDTVFGDHAQAFTLNTEVNIGSTTKAVATTPAVLHLIDHRQDLSLGTFIRDVLPNRWSNELHSRWQNVTLDMMLQHRGGFKPSGNNNPWSASNARARLSTGDLPNPPAVGARSYSNASMGMFHFMMMAMGSKSEWAAHEAAAANFHDTSYDNSLAWANADYYERYVKKFVLEPANVTGTCNMQELVNVSGPFEALYSSPSDQTGVITPDNSLHCAAGAWIMSIKELVRLVHTLRHTDNILSRSTYSLMEDRTPAAGSAVSTNDTSLGWFGRTVIPGGWVFRHNGLNNVNGHHANSHVVIYPNGYIAAIVSNSPHPSGVDPDQALLDAFTESFIPSRPVLGPAIFTSRN